MGKTLEKLATGNIQNRTIFNSRFVVEICEKVHLHYRNLRVNLSLQDFISMAGGIMAASARWAQLGRPEPAKGQHIELCRRKVAQVPHNDEIQVNLNKNLYLENKGKIYAEGADFEDKTYIHLKIRDLRLELTITEFKELANVIKQAQERLASIDTGTVL